METKIIAMPFIGAVIGLVTNWIAIKMLFHPRKKILGIQGVIPKRKKEIAKRIGEASPIILPEYFNRIKKIRFVGDAVHSKLIDYFKQGVGDKIENLNDREIEEVIIKTTKKELRFLVWIGGIVGFLAGCIQALILLI